PSRVAVVVNVAVAVPPTLANAVLVPSVVMLPLKVSLMVKVPVGKTEPTLGVTVIVKVTAWPKLDEPDGLAEAMVEVVGALFTARLVVVKVVLLAPKVVSPL